MLKSPRLLRRLAPAALLVAAACGLPASAVAAEGPAYVPGEVVVRYAPGADRADRAAAQRGTGTGAPEAFAPRTRVLRIRDGEGVAETIAELERRPGVLSATPHWIARISALVPNDPGPAGVPGGWQETQWNFLAGAGVNAPGAWENLLAAGRPGGQGTTVAVLDTGVAYANRRPFVRSPDLTRGQFAPGYDFVSDDRYPNDDHGHGTHVASTIAESTGNGYGLTGLAYGARIMPVRVLNKLGEGGSAAIAGGIRFAAREGADVINLSVEFDTTVGAREIPEILDALRYARRKGALVIGASGNAHARTVALPARAASVLSVGATTEHLCLGEYSNEGPGLDLVAPGGGADAPDPRDVHCQPPDPNGFTAGRDIYQLTFAGRSPRRFGLPDGYYGTSMAAPHVAATAALIIASGVLGPDPTPAAVEARLKATARDLGEPGPDDRYGAGLIDAAAATAR